MQAVLVVLSALAHAFSAICAGISNHSASCIVAAFFLGKHMPEQIPFTPQAYWAWARAAVQSYISTKEPKDPPPPQNPTQPAPTTPVQQTNP